jgi:hypothetical protein
MTKPIVSFHNSANAPKKAENKLFRREAGKTEFYGRDCAPHRCGLSLQQINNVARFRHTTCKRAKCQNRTATGTGAIWNELCYGFPECL